MFLATYSLRLASVSALAGKWRPSNTNIGLMLWDNSIFTYFKQYVMCLLREMKEKNRKLNVFIEIFECRINNSHISLFAAHQFITNSKSSFVQPKIQTQEEIKFNINKKYVDQTAKIVIYIYFILSMLSRLSYQQYESIATDLLASVWIFIFSLALSRNGSKPVIPITT